MKFLFALFIVISLNIFSSNKIEVIYPNRDGMGKEAYGYQLLELILPKTGKNYNVKLANEYSNQKRALAKLELGEYSVVDIGIGKEFETRFDPIYIPIDRGLLGWRLFIIHKKNKNLFKSIDTIDKLKDVVAGQGTGWSDNFILENSGIKVVTSSKIENLFNMLEKGRFDFFPLGMNEIHAFFYKYARNNEELIIEDSLVLVYPFARIFYVKKGNTELQNDIKLGLEKAFDDGSFISFLKEHPTFKEGFEKSNIENRTVIRIENPLMKNTLDKIDKKWWYNFDE